ncbi:MAG: transposase [Bacillota bacterium]|nr:transposase [Bacillota bacterium]
MVRSISEILLFKNSKDKEKYLEIIQKYKEIYLFDVYAYCLMSTHAHLVIDCCEADISKIMKSINQSYSSYYNYTYNRHGHVFQDRFKSKIIDNDNYLLNLTAYIHNNPKDITEYAEDVSKYPYSSLGIFLGKNNYMSSLVNYKHILGYFSQDIIRARKTYLELMNRMYNIDNSAVFENLRLESEFCLEKSEYRSERNIIFRNVSPDMIVKYISKESGIYFNPHLKHSRKNDEFKALFVIIMRSLSNHSLKEICTYISNTTLSNIWRLSEKGFNLITGNIKYTNMFNELVGTYKNYIPTA